MKPDEDFAEEFFKVARTNPYYEQILWNMNTTFASEVAYGITAKEKLKRKLKKVLPKDSWLRTVARNIYYATK